MAVFTPDNRIAGVHGSIYRTRRELIPLAVLLTRKGIDITAEELEAAAPAASTLSSCSVPRAPPHWRAS